jgi:hypothetical protein
MHLIKSILISPFSSPWCGLKGFLVLAFTLFFQKTHAQYTVFQQSYSLGYAENTQFILQTSQGKFIVGGEQGINLSTKKGFFISIDGSGNQEFSRIIGTNEHTTSINNALIIKDSILVFIGRSSSYTSNLQLLVWQYHVNGDSMSSWNYGDSDLEFGLSIDKVGEDAQNGFILSGGKVKPQAFIPDAWVVRIDSSGNKLWERSLGSLNRAVATKVLTCADGGYIVTGTIENNLASNGPTAYLWKLDSLGNTVWVNYYGAESYLGNGLDVIEKPNGGYYMCGLTGFYDAPRNLWLNVPYLISTNQQGDTLWTWKNSYPREGILQSMVSKGNELWLTGTWLTWGSDYDMLLIRFNTDTKASSYTTFGDGSVEFGFGIISTIDGGFALAGRKTNTQSTAVYLVKTDNNGCIQPGCMQAVSVQEHLQANLDLKIYPNPVIDQLNIESNFEQGSLQLQISDMQGRTVHSEQQPAHAEIQLQLSHLPSGMYLLCIQNGQQTAWARFVKR